MGPRAQGPAAPSLQVSEGLGDGWALEVRQRRRRQGSWEELQGRCRAASVGRRQSCHGSPLFPLGRPSPIFPTLVASLSSFPSIRKVPRKGKNLVHLFTLRNETAGGFLHISSQYLEKACRPGVLESPSPSPHPSLPALLP